MPLNELQESWGTRLREARTDQQMSLAKLSRITEINTAQLSRAERGLVGLSDNYRMRIAEALCVRVEDIWSYPDTTQAAS